MRVEMNDGHRAPLSEDVKTEVRRGYVRALSDSRSDDLESLLKLHNFATLQLMRDPKCEETKERWLTTMEVVLGIFERTKK